ncbi:MAG TPA: sigma-E factor negative regulatory protein [Ramlibacter sp.]|nr:sigma-E factor negative regulatory protein [Ramlibacter sp.]
MDKIQTQEIISALADGQLQGDEFAHGVALAAGDAAAREAWHTYHLIGDVLRSGEIAAGTMPTAFMSRLQLRLQQESRQPAAAAVPTFIPAGTGLKSAANDDSFRWKLVAGFASLAAMAAIGWTAMGVAGKPEQAQLAATPAPAVLAGTGREVMLRDPKLDEFLAAHRQLGGASALQMPAGFLRNATFEQGPGR